MLGEGAGGLPASESDGDEVLPADDTLRYPRNELAVKESEHRDAQRGGECAQNKTAWSGGTGTSLQCD